MVVGGLSCPGTAAPTQPPIIKTGIQSTVVPGVPGDVGVTLGWGRRSECLPPVSLRLKTSRNIFGRG